MFTNFFDINNVFFTLWDYPMSYLEFFGTILNIVTVWLCTKKNIWNWPIGIAATVLFAVLFYKIQLYSDFFEQIYFLITGVWGWWAWSTLRRRSVQKTEQSVTALSKEGIVWTGVGLIVGTMILGWFMSRIHLFFPGAFPEAASFPYLDAFTTVASFAAQILLIFKKVENWYLWILVDVIGVWLYNEKEVRFVAILYFIFLILATKGYLSWKKELAANRSRIQIERKGVERV